MNRVLVVFSDGLLSELDSARGLISRSAWIRQAVEDKLMKEAVAPLVPDSDTRFFLDSGPVHSLTEIRGEYLGTPEETEVLDRMHGITPNEFEAEKAKPKARRKKSVKDSPTAISVEDGGDRDAARKGQKPSESPSLPARCNRGACTGTINPVSGRCLHCNQTPLKKSSGEETEAPLVPATRVFERAEWDSFSSNRIKGGGKK